MIGGAVPTVEGVRESIGPRFDLAVGATRRRRQTWLDTADWRLYRKGITCELLNTSSAAMLVLHGPNDERRECLLPAGTQAPLRLEHVPDGLLRDRLSPLLGIRALLPLVQSSRTVREVRLLDDEAKTVVRLLLDGPATVRGLTDGAVPARLHVIPVRGYVAQSRKVARTLREQGLLPDETEPSDAVAALTTGGYTPGVLPGAVDPPPAQHTPAAVAVATMLLSFLDQLEAQVPGAVGDIDVEFLHDLRIAVRRSRSALKLAGGVLPPGTVERFAPELKWLGDVTTPARDLDVHLLGLPDMAGRLAAFPHADLDPFGEHLARHRVGEQRALVRALTSRRYERFVTDWRSALQNVVAAGHDPGDGVNAGALAAAQVARADRRVVRRGSRITADSPPEDLHTLRKRAKELRYTLDLFVFVLDATHVKALVTELKALQDVLGAFQDSEVQRAALRAVATQMVAEQNARRVVPVDTLLALGELATHLEEDQRRAREAFDKRFTRFLRPSVRRHVKALSDARPVDATPEVTS